MHTHDTEISEITEKVREGLPLRCAVSTLDTQCVCLQCLSQLIDYYLISQLAASVCMSVLVPGVQLDRA